MNLVGGRRLRLLAAAVWLFYLGQPLSRLLDAAGVERLLGLAGLVVFVLLYLGGLLAGPAPGEFDRPTWSAGLIVALLACAAVTVPGAGDASLTFLVFVSAFGVARLRTPLAVALVAVLLATTELAGRVVPGWDEGGIGLGVVLAGVAVWGLRTAITRQRALIEAERELAEAALAGERDRIARDLHDILGHSLTVIAVKAELAQRLLDVDGERARRELADLETLTRDALADVRATTQGLRGVSLPGEIAAAAGALDAAGIRAELPTAVDAVPTRWRELYAWTLREAVTNVIRHSGATRCRVEIGPTALTVTDDGRGAHGSAGHGLDGLTERARLAGAALHTGPGPDGRGFEVGIVVPAPVELAR